MTDLTGDAQAVARSVVDGSPGNDTAFTSPSAFRSVKVAAMWLAPASQERMSAGGVCSIDDGIEAVPNADIVAISTRTPRVRVGPLMEQLVAAARGPIVVICHAGGERAAVDLMRRGANGIIAEGNEETIRRFHRPDLDDADGDVEELVGTYARRLDSVPDGSTWGTGHDPVTNLPGSAAFEYRFGELSRRGNLPRLAFLRVISGDPGARLDRDAKDLVRRRMASLFSGLSRNHGAELFGLGDDDYALLAREMQPRAAQELGRHLAGVASSFAPTSGTPMRLAMGHAGPEVANESRTLRDLATGALAAAQAEGGGVVDADELSRSQASSTELDAAIELAREIDIVDPYPVSHSSRVADLAIEVAREVGLDGHELVRLRLAALLHDVGKIGISPALIFKRQDQLAPSEVADWQQHPSRGAQYAGVSAGPEVAEAIRHHHERWDGDGFPDGLSGDAIPLSSRILAVADRIDALRAAHSDPHFVADALRNESGTSLDPAVVDAAAAIIEIE